MRIFLNIRTVFKSFFLFLKQDCTPGYLWVNCSKACRYPSYGERCSKTCTCVEHLCNVTIGCIDCKYRRIIAIK